MVAIELMLMILNDTHVTVKSALAVTSIKQSTVLKCDFVLSCHRTFHMN